MTAFSIESLDLLFEGTDAQWFPDNQAAAKIIDVGSIKLDLRMLSIKIFLSCLGRAINRDLASRLRQTANVRLKFPVYQKLVKFTWFQFIFCLLATAMKQVQRNKLE